MTNSRRDHASVLARVMRASTGIDTMPRVRISARSRSNVWRVVEAVRRQHRDERQGEDQRGQRQEDVEAAREDRVGPAPVVAGDETERAADEQREDDRADADEQRATRAPQMHRANTSWPLPSPPRNEPSNGPLRTMPTLISFGSAIGRIGARTAEADDRRATRSTARRRARASSLRGRRPRASRRRRRRARPSATTVVSGSRAHRLRYPQRPGVPDPRIQHGVEDVDEEVHEHVDDRDDRNQALHRDVLPARRSRRRSACRCPATVDALDDRPRHR